MGPTERLNKVTDILAGTGAVQDPNQLPWNPNASRFPSRKELPKIPGAPDGAAWVWGEHDQLGRLNLLTPERVKAAAAEIKTGEMVRLDLPLDVPKTPAFGREVFHHTIKPLGGDVAYDDTYVLNTQSGSQWDGFRHFAHLETKYFYNGTTASHIESPTPETQSRCSIHHWATHCIAARAILLDYRHYAQTNSIHYDPYTSHAISLSDLHACAASQGIDIRPASQGGDIQPGDILLIRSGFVQRYHELPPSTRDGLASRPHDDTRFAGLKQEPQMLDWLHDCYFAAVAGDSPTFERWPPESADADADADAAAGEGKGIGFLHESILALWGMPLGEMWDLEKVARVCRRLGRWSFFLTSAPANVVGGVSSHPNATAIF